MASKPPCGAVKKSIAESSFVVSRFFGLPGSTAIGAASSPAQAGDPVLIDGAVSTGLPACTGNDEQNLADLRVRFLRKRTEQSPSQRHHHAVARRQVRDLVAVRQ